ncbi:hypothetical protein ACFX1X_041138 [Malus domestica]
MVKDVATYFSMTLGAFVFWQSLDEVHVQIALYQDEKPPPSDYEPHRHPPCSTVTPASFPHFPKPISPPFPQLPSACPQLTLHHNHYQDVHNIGNSNPKLPFFFVDEDLYKLGFEKVTEEFIGECKSEALLLRHKKTGVQVASMSNDDENKVFDIVF